MSFSEDILLLLYYVIMKSLCVIIIIYFACVDLKIINLMLCCTYHEKYLLSIYFIYFIYT